MPTSSRQTGQRLREVSNNLTVQVGRGFQSSGEARASEAELAAAIVEENLQRNSESGGSWSRYVDHRCHDL